MLMKVRIGLETHVQLNTKTKMFCSCPLPSIDAKPNTHVCDVCLGFPGTKPRLNKIVIDHAIRIALALNCEITNSMFFSRKSYFYPDMSKNYQITQYELPVGINGYVLLDKKKVRIKRIQLEEDPAKLLHEGGDIIKSRLTLIDYNRSGIPLVEIVTEPDLESPSQARDYLGKIKSILEHLGAYDESKGVIKTDANISLPDSERVEVKNITGLRGVERALSYESIRHKNLLTLGESVARETRHFNEKTGMTFSLRLKETETDYGYIFEPDLSWISITPEKVQALKKSMPELPDERIERFIRKSGLSRENAVTLVSDKALADFFEVCASLYKNIAKLANFTTTDLLKCLNYNNLRITDSKITPQGYVDLLESIDSGKITARMAKELIKEYVMTGTQPKELINKKSLKIIPESEVEKAVEKVIKKNKQAVLDYKHGSEKSINFLVGEVMKLTKGQARPEEVTKLIKKLV